MRTAALWTTMPFALIATAVVADLNNVCRDTTIHCVAPTAGSAEFDSIQDAVRVAVDGDDVVLCEPGTYDVGTGVTFREEAITVRALNKDNRGSTIVTGGNSVFQFRAGNDGIVLRWLTIADGGNSYYKGGGVRVGGARPPIPECTSESSQAPD